MNRSSEFELEAFNRCFVGGVPEVSVGVEWFFDAEGVVLHQMPSLCFFLETATCANRDDFMAVIKLESKSNVNTARCGDHT